MMQKSLEEVRSKRGSRPHSASQLRVHHHLDNTTPPSHHHFLDTQHRDSFHFIPLHTAATAPPTLAFCPRPAQSAVAICHDAARTHSLASVGDFQRAQRRDAFPSQGLKSQTHSSRRFAARRSHRRPPRLFAAFAASRP